MFDEVGWSFGDAVRLAALGASAHERLLWGVE